MAGSLIVSPSPHPALSPPSEGAERVSDTTCHLSCGLFSRHTKHHSNLALLLITASVLAGGCKVGPDHRSPSVLTPARFHHENTVAVGPTNATLAEWWKVFGDAQLDSLVAEAATANHDVRIAVARVREARALRGISRSALFPEINGGGDYSRSRVSKNTPGGMLARATGQGAEGDLFDIGPDMNWEIDIFGGTRRGVEAAQADLEAAGESSRDTLITVLAEVGLNYLELRGAQKQLAVARENLRTQEDTLALTLDRRNAGLASELDTARAEGQVANTRSQIPPLEESIQRAIHRLGVLLGKAPAELETQLVKTAPLPGATPGVPIGLPSDLLRRRPDIRRAEREVAAATARIGVATADLFPRFFLTGAAGFQSVEASDFLDGGSRFWSLGPSVRWPVFTAGRIRQNIRVQNARQEQTLLRYEQTVLKALEETENALVAFGREQERHRALTESEQASRRAAVLANDRYRGGLVDFLDVLEAERLQLAAQDSVVQSERRMSQNFVRLYKSVGGGWQPTGGR